MLSFLKKYRLPIIIGLLILVPLFNLSSNLKSPKELKWYDRVVLWVMAPFQKAVTGGMNQIVYVINHYALLVNAKIENDSLKKENSRLAGTVSNMQEIQSENERLRKLLAFKEKYLASGVSAEVIARDTTSEYQTIRINKGGDVGLKVRMPVMTPEGIVGQLITVWQHYSDVLLLTDQNHAIDIIVQRSRARGVVKGGDRLKCEIHYLARTDDVVIGDVLVSSGIEGIFPKGLLVGTIGIIEKKTFGVSQRVVVSPAVDLSKLEEVLVITNLSSVRLPPDLSVQ
jgi:rod shape-determining protein MreC